MYDYLNFVENEILKGTLELNYACLQSYQILKNYIQ